MYRNTSYIKKIFITGLLTIILVFSGCTKAVETAVTFEFDSNGNYTGFENLPKNYDEEQAKKDGCFVRRNGGKVAGEHFWDKFLADASNGKDAGIRIVNIYDDATYYLDIFYKDGYYRAFDSSSRDLSDKKFKYLLILEGKLPNAAKSGKAFILTDNEYITYDDVMWKYLSSNTRFTDTIPPFELLLLE